MRPTTELKPARLAGALAALALCAFATGTAAQEFDADEPNPRERVMRNFSEKAPAIGEPLPDLTVFDAEGKPFKLRSLKGHYSVLVFGCLT